MQIKFKFDIPIERKFIQLKMKWRRRNRPQIDVKNEGRDYLYNHLLGQELSMWFNFPETFKKDDWEFIVNRRGFNIREQHCLLLALYTLGFDVADINLIDLTQYRKEQLLMQQAMLELQNECAKVSPSKERFGVTKES